MRSLWPPRNLVADSTTRSAAELERPADVRAGERVVDDEDRPVSSGELGEGRVVGHEGRRVGDGLRVEQPRRRGVERGIDRVEIGHVDERDVDAEPAEHAAQQHPGRAVGRRRGHDPVAGPDDRGDGRMDGPHPGCQRDTGFATGELRVGRAEGARRRVRDPAVGEPAARVGGDAAELVGIARCERGRLVDRHARRPLVEPRHARRRADRARSRSRSGRRVAVAGRGRSPLGCYHRTRRGPVAVSRRDPP